MGMFVIAQRDVACAIVFRAELVRIKHDPNNSPQLQDQHTPAPSPFPALRRPLNDRRKSRSSRFGLLFVPPSFPSRNPYIPFLFTYISLFGIPIPPQSYPFWNPAFPYMSLFGIPIPLQSFLFGIAYFPIFPLFGIPSFHFGKAILPREAAQPALERGPSKSTSKSSTSSWIKSSKQGLSKVRFLSFS